MRGVYELFDLIYRYGSFDAYLTIDAPAPVQIQQKNDAKSVVGLYKVGVKEGN